MPSVTASTTPTTLNGGSAHFVRVTNTGSVDAAVTHNGTTTPLLPSCTTVVSPIKSAVTVATAAGTTTVDYLAGARDLAEMERLGAFVSPASGEYVMSQFYSGGGTGAPTLGVISFAPLWVPERTKFDRINTSVTAAATAGGVARLGVYSPDGKNRPGALLAATAALPTTATGYVEATIDITVPRGLLWLAHVSQVAAATFHTLGAGHGSAGSPPWGGIPEAPFYMSQYPSGGMASTVTLTAGALPDEASPVTSYRNDTSVIPALKLRAA